MTPLRQKMIDEMLLHGFAERTKDSYLRSVALLAKHYRQSPDTLTSAQIKDYFLYLVKERKVSASTCRLRLNALKFLYVEVLQQQWFNDMKLVIPKKPQRIPELLSHAEVVRILAKCHNQKHLTLLSTCYACGLRVSELVGLQLQHLDYDRQVVRIEQGKGRKDRLLLLTNHLGLLLERYCQRYAPQMWLFYGEDRQKPMHVNTASRVYAYAKAAANIQKTGGIHSLRHAYATHQLEAGVPVHQLQHLLGHRNLHSTLHYVHWNPTLPQGAGVDLLADKESEEALKEDVNEDLDDDLKDDDFGEDA
jgi:site-specific recombinase XerD